VSAIDATALNALEQLYAVCQKKKVELILSHVNEQPRHMMEKAGFIDKIGEDHICGHIDDALALSEKLLEGKEEGKRTIRVPHQ
jgi:SulP family sulfate permease